MLTLENYLAELLYCTKATLLLKLLKKTCDTSVQLRE